MKTFLTVLSGVLIFAGTMMSAGPLLSGGAAGMKGGKMVRIPGGAFTMGCDRKTHDPCPRNARPAHKVTVDPYEIDVTEVTAADYFAFLKAHGNKCGPDICIKKYGSTKQFKQQGDQWIMRPGAEKKPALGVTWYGADEYCRWAGKRLPSSAEWELAARGTDQRMFPWGNQPPTCERAVMKNDADKGCGTDYVMDVCSKPKGNSPYGLCDMAGNVLEWVSDWYAGDYYENSPKSNPQGPSTGTEKVLRGGHYRTDYAKRFTTVYVDNHRPGKDLSKFGFRCARSIK